MTAGSDLEAPTPKISTQAVAAQVNYAQCAPGDTIDYRLDDWSGFAVRPATVSIHDAGTFERPASLDREGFMVTRLESAVTDFRSPTQIDKLWRPQVHRLLQTLTGASRVLSWAVNSRFSERSTEAGKTVVSGPARRVHSDFSPADFVGQIRHPQVVDLLSATGNPNPRSWKCFNIWQPLCASPHDTPLALCDATTVAPEDLIPARGVIRGANQPDFSVNLCLLRHNARHRWCYFSGLTLGDALIFCGLDPTAQAPHRVVPHTAFDNPICPADAPPRNSIEIRALAVFDT